MKNILHIDSSARRTDNATTSYNSISKGLGSYFMDAWMSKNHQSEVTYRDLGLNPVDFISQDWIAAVFTPEDNRSTEQQSLLALSDELIAEVDKADLIVMTTPMYNYGMPAVLKSWFDQVIRINKTFTFDLARGNTPLEPIMSGKTLVLLTSSGEFGFASGEIRAHMNHLGPHIQVMSKYLGVDHFHEIQSEYQEFPDHRHAASVERAKQSMVELINKIDRPS